MFLRQFSSVEGREPTPSTSPDAATTETALQSLMEQLEREVRAIGYLTEILSVIVMAGSALVRMDTFTGATDSSRPTVSIFLGGEFEDRNSLSEPGTY